MSVKVQQEVISHEIEKQIITQKQEENKKKQRKTRVRWSKVEDLKYFLFLFHHKNRFIQSEIRRSLRMFKQMAFFMKTRDASQCRVRHLKLVRKYDGIQKCLQNYINTHPQFTEKYNKIKAYLHILEDNLYFGDFQIYQNNDRKVQKIETDQKLNISVKIQDPSSTENKNIQINNQNMQKVNHTASNQIKQENCKVQQEYINYYHFYTPPGYVFNNFYYM